MEDSIKRTRAKKKLIKVTFPSGKSFCYNNATTTMAAVLSEIGVERFPEIKLELCHLPLLSQEVYPRLEKWMKPVCDGWYFNAQSDSDQKYMQLRIISEQLSLGLTIEIGTELETEESPKVVHKKCQKDKLLVRFPDGDFVAGESVLDTFLETVWKLGVEDIKRKNLTWGNKPLITNSKVVNSQIQVDERSWIIVPGLTKDKVKLLRVIAAMLHINLEITTI